MDADGLAEGLCEGLAEGLREGLVEGLIEGLAEGLREGLSEGLGTGPEVKLGYSVVECVTEIPPIVKILKRYNWLPSTLEVAWMAKSNSLYLFLVTVDE